jgi:hypothetical protein
MKSRTMSLPLAFVAGRRFKVQFASRKTLSESGLKSTNKASAGASISRQPKQFSLPDDFD